MLDIKYIRENVKAVKQAVVNKKTTANIDHLISLDDQRRKLLVQIEDLRSQRNEINDKLKDGKDEALIEKNRSLKAELGKFELEFDEVLGQFYSEMLKVPNLPVEDVPVGLDESQNKVLRQVGQIPTFNFQIKDHLELGELLGIIDMERAAKVSGARFGYKKGAAVLLEAAIIQFVFSVLTNRETLRQIADTVDTSISDRPFIPVLPPVMIKPDVYTRTGRLSPEDAEDKYKMALDELYLIGSAEHTLVAMHMDEVFNNNELPLRYIGFSTCFRREAGSYGKDTKGMLRVHQFDKLEMESFSTSENSLLEHKFLVAIQEYLVQQLELPYQLVINCTGDMGKPNARQIDIETWLPGQEKYRETHSADYMTDFQARRLNIKYRKVDGSTEFVHTNDATAIAMSRMPIAILENNQQADGSIRIPKVLQKYMGSETISCPPNKSSSTTP